MSWGWKSDSCPKLFVCAVCMLSKGLHWFIPCDKVTVNGPQCATACTCPAADCSVAHSHASGDPQMPLSESHAQANKIYT